MLPRVRQGQCWRVTDWFGKILEGKMDKTCAMFVIGSKGDMKSNNYCILCKLNGEQFHSEIGI